MACKYNDTTGSGFIHQKAICHTTHGTATSQMWLLCIEYICILNAWRYIWCKQRKERNACSSSTPLKPQWKYMYDRQARPTLKPHLEIRRIVYHLVSEHKSALQMQFILCSWNGYAHLDRFIDLWRITLRSQCLEAFCRNGLGST